jgi:hypothetical protein
MEVGGRCEKIFEHFARDKKAGCATGDVQGYVPSVLLVRREVGLLWPPVHHIILSLRH